MAWKNGKHLRWTKLVHRVTLWGGTGKIWEYLYIRSECIYEWHVVLTHYSRSTVHILDGELPFLAWRGVCHFSKSADLQYNVQIFQSGISMMETQDMVLKVQLKV